MSSLGSPPARRCVRVAYVLTHFPKLSQTFISSEIDVVRSLGSYVRIFAMNPPEEGEVSAASDRARMAETTYLKHSITRVLKAVFRQIVLHPVLTSKVTGMALMSAGGSPLRVARRLAHLAQAMLVAQEVERDNLNYIHAQFGLAPATIAWFASALTEARGRRVPFGFTIHGYHDFVSPEESRLDLKVRDAAQVLCISDFTKSQLCQITPPEDWDRFMIARCGVDLSQIKYRERSTCGRLPTVLAVGRLSPEKGFSVLIDALAILSREGLPQRARILGDGPMRASLEQQAKRAGVEKLVEFVGEVEPEEVRAQLGLADWFCLPSFSEGLPISVMEAMAAGLPVVCTWIAGIPELAKAEVTALTVPPARADALAEALRRLAADPSLRVRLAKAARAEVEQLHDRVGCGEYIAHRFAEVAR